MHVDHIGVATDDADGLATLYGTLFDAPTVHEEAFDGLRFVFLELGADSYFELLEPIEADTKIGRYVEREGPGIHHVALATEDIDAALERAREYDVRLIDEEPRQGAWGHDVAFLHPKSTGGVLVEFVQREVPVADPFGERFRVRVVGGVGHTRSFCGASLTRSGSARRPRRSTDRTGCALGDRKPASAPHIYDGSEVGRMVSILGFVVQLVTSVVDLVRIFLFEVFLGVDPLSAISFLVGAGLTTATVAYFAYLVVGAIVNQFTGLGSSARESEPKHPTK